MSRAFLLAGSFVQSLEPEPATSSKTCPHSSVRASDPLPADDLHGHCKVFFQLDGEKFSAIASRQKHSAMFSIWWSGNLSGRMGYSSC